MMKNYTYTVNIDIDNIFKSIMPEIEDLRMGEGFTSIEKKLPNGASTHVEVDSEGFSYRRIELINVSVSNSGDDEKYSEELFNMLLDRIQELNWIEEEKYEEEYAL